MQYILLFIVHFKVIMLFIIYFMLLLFSDKVLLMLWLLKLVSY